MKKKTLVSVIAVVMAFLLVMSLMLSAMGSMGALASDSGSGSSSSSGSDYQSQIDEIEKQKEELQSQREDMEANLSSLMAERETALEQKALLDEQNQYAQEEIELINEQISLYNNLLEEKSAELEDAQAAESEQYDLYCKRVRAMEENGSYTYLDMIFNCGSIGELLSAMDDISEIMKADQRLFEQYKTARENTEKVLGEYEDTLSGLNDKQSELETRRAELERQIEEATALIADLDEDIEQAQQEYLANEAAEQALNDQMNQIAWEMWQQEQAQKEEENNNNNTGDSGSTGGNSGTGGDSGSAATGTYIWPCPSSTYITSRYGNRIHPIFGTERFHSGIDIGANEGATVLAADGGTVTVATYSSSYGNYVMIYHTNGTYTLYAHMSSLAVSAGQTVTQGQTIGYVGSTGWSNGPHLHFEIRNANGGTEDPTAYFSGLSYSADA